MLRDTTILITGGTGSFGRAFVRHLIEMSEGPAKVIVFSRDEHKQEEMAKEFGATDLKRLRFWLGDVRDLGRLQFAFRGVDYVVHAAALKRVPQLETNPFEAIRTNIVGAQNVIHAAINQGVRRVVAIGSDKGVAPVNLYGASKLAQEKLFVAANALSREGQTSFACLRYGNVLGSRGSVVPLWEEQARRDLSITITDRDMTRFWITLPQTCCLALKCLAHEARGAVYVPKLPTVYIDELATVVAARLGGVRQKVVGLRPGEKLHEKLIGEDESPWVLEYKDGFMVTPAHPSWGFEPPPNGKAVPSGFSYRSDKNLWTLRGDALRAALADSP